MIIMKMFGIASSFQGGLDFTSRVSSELCIYALDPLLKEFQMEFWNLGYMFDLTFVILENLDINATSSLLKD